MANHFPNMRWFARPIGDLHPILARRRVDPDVAHGKRNKGCSEIT